MAESNPSLQTAVAEMFAARNQAPEPDADTRLSHLERLRNALCARKSDIYAALATDLGKSEAEADMSEIAPLLIELRHARRHLRRWIKPARVGPVFPFWGTTSSVHPKPKGLVLIIAPWNYPFNLTLGPLVCALAAGNRIVVKPSERTPASSAVIDAMLKDAFDPTLVRVVLGEADTARALIDCSFDHIHFTGGPEVGSEVMAAAATHHTSVTLELGGKSPAIVEESADLQTAAERIAAGKFLNGGQTCIAPDYVLAQESIADDLTRLLKKTLTELLDTAVEQGLRMTTFVDERHERRITALLDDARDKGAIVWNHHGLYLLSNVPLKADVFRQEIFGPVLPVIRFGSTTEIAALAERSGMPLTAYVFSRDDLFIEEVTTQVRAGSFSINETLLHFAHPGLPFGGIRRSGFGRSHGKAGFDSFSNRVPVMRHRFGPSAFTLIYPEQAGWSARLRKWLMRFLESS